MLLNQRPTVGQEGTTMKFNNRHDEYLYEGAVTSGVVSGHGDPDGPVGWFAPITLIDGHPFEADGDERSALDFYGTEWLIMHESNEGFVTVRTFDTEVKRNDTVNQLVRLDRMLRAGITDGEAREAIDGYLQAARHAAILTHADGSTWLLGDQELSWSPAAQSQIADEVTDFITQNVKQINEWREATGHAWLQVGIDFHFTRNLLSQTFATRDNAGVVAGATVLLVQAAEAWGRQVVVVDANGELGVQ
jgi:hypothetical protein